MGVVRRLANRTLTEVNKPRGRASLKRALQSASPVYLELGAWRTTRPGWIATDVSWRSPNFLDVARPWPIASSSVDAIFSDNVIEHLSLSQARVALVEAFRVLKPGGQLRSVTPDIGALADLYLLGPEATALLREELANEGYLVAHQVDVLRFVFQDDGHHLGYLWDQASLRSELEAVGFEQIEFCHPGESRHEMLRGLDMRTDVPLAKAMLATDAVKPT